MSVEKDFTFTFTWKIFNYSLCYQEKGEALRSPVVTAEPLWGTKWILKIYPRGMTGAEEYVSCYLERKHDAQKKTIHVDFEVKILTKENHVLKCQQYDDVMFEKTDCRGWSHFMEIRDVIYALKNSTTDTLFICCVIKRTALKLTTAVECVAQTTIAVECANFDCSVISLEDLDKPSRIDISNTHFLPLEILFSATDTDLDISIKSLEKKCSLVVHIRISLIDVRLNEHCSKFSTHFFKHSNENLWHFPIFISKQMLLTNKTHLMRKNRFVLKFEIYIARRIESEEIECYKPLQNETAHHKSVLPLSLKEDMKHMLDSRKYCDVNIRLGDKLIPVHKAVLAARSPVFSAMFDQHMFESENNIVDIIDVDEEIFHVFIKFIYTSVIENIDYEIILQLLIVADKYQVQSLIEECSSLLVSGLSKDNVCEVFTLADLTNNKILRDTALDFMVNNASDILSLSCWNHWTEQNVKLTSEFFSRLTFQLKSITSPSNAVKSTPSPLKK